MSKRIIMGVRGSKPQMKVCPDCGDDFQKVFIGQQKCKNCLGVKKQ